MAAIEALAARTEREGHPKVDRYWWYVDADGGRAGATIVYADADGWLAHHHMAYEWPEMAVLQATVSLERLTVLGPTTPEVDDWLSGAGLTVNQYPGWAAGFGRADA